MLSIIYTLLLGLLCACFVEAGIYAFFPAPKHCYGMYPRAEPPTDDEIEKSRNEDEAYRIVAERHSLRHYVMSLLGSTIQAGIALKFHGVLGVLADGILLGSVFTLGTGTIFGISGGGRVARFAVATVSLLAALGLGWLEFLPHG